MNLKFTSFAFSNQDICAEHMPLMNIIVAGGKR